MNLDKRGDIMLLCYQRCRFRLKNSCSKAFLRSVESRRVHNTMPQACFVTLKGFFFVEPLNWHVVLQGIQYHAT